MISECVAGILYRATYLTCNMEPAIISLHHSGALEQIFSPGVAGSVTRLVMRGWSQIYRMTGV